MMKNDTQESPIGVVLSATFFILVGTWFFAQISFSQNSILFFSIIYTLIGTLFIILGWAILNLKPWGHTFGILVSGCGLLFGLIFGVFMLGTAPIYTIILLLFIPVFLLLQKHKSLYFKTVTSGMQSQADHRGRWCTNCGRTIPFDANICPYCGKKFESYL